MFFGENEEQMRTADNVRECVGDRWVIRGQLNVAGEEELAVIVFFIDGKRR